MSIHRTKTGKWEVRYREGARNRSKTFDLKKDARAFESANRLAQQRGETFLRRGDVPTLEEFATSWLDGRELKGLATNTLLANSRLLDKQILPSLGHLPLVDLTPDRLDRWQEARLKDGASAYTLNKARELLIQICNVAVKRRLMAANTPEHLDYLAHKTRKGKAITPLQVEIMRGYMIERDRPGYATMLSVGAYGGLRPPSELLAPDWTDLSGAGILIDSRNVDGVIVFGTKTGEDRIVPLPAAVQTDLEVWREVQGGDGLIFARSDGLPWRKQDWRNWTRRWFRPAAGAAGLLEWDKENMTWIGDLRPYDLRHTCASLRIRAGDPLAEIAADLGHSIATLVRDYAHEIEAMRGQPVVSVDDAIAEARREVLNPDVRKMFGEEAVSA